MALNDLLILLLVLVAIGLVIGALVPNSIWSALRAGPVPERRQGPAHRGYESQRDRSAGHRNFGNPRKISGAAANFGGYSMVDIEGYPLSENCSRLDGTEPGQEADARRVLDAFDVPQRKPVDLGRARAMQAAYRESFGVDMPECP